MSEAAAKRCKLETGVPEARADASVPPAPPTQHGTRDISWPMHSQRTESLPDLLEMDKTVAATNRLLLFVLLAKAFTEAHKLGSGFDETEAGLPNIGTSWRVLYEVDYEEACRKYSITKPTGRAVRNQVYYWLAKSTGCVGKGNNITTPAYAIKAVKEFWPHGKDKEIPEDYRDALRDAVVPTGEEVDSLIAAVLALTPP